jgi:CBS domain-containing protein
MTIGEICTRDVIIAFREDSIIEIAKLMRQYHVGDIVIVDKRDNQKHPIGIVTDRDIVLELVAKEVDISRVTAGDVMSTDLLMVNEQDGLTVVLDQMRAKGVRRIPVVNENKELIGIATENDIIELISEQLSDLVSLVEKGDHREYVNRS